MIKIYSKDKTLRPKPATKGSAGIDICTIKDMVFSVSKKIYIVQTGLYVAIPKDHFGMIVPRSSMGQKGLYLANTIGIIDSDYRGEIILLVKFRVEDRRILNISKGERIAQLLVIPHAPIAIMYVNNYEELETTDRGTGGFGSTGTHNDSNKE